MQIISHISLNFHVCVYGNFRSLTSQLTGFHISYKPPMRIVAQIYALSRMVWTYMFCKIISTYLHAIHLSHIQIHSTATILSLYISPVLCALSLHSLVPSHNNFAWLVRATSAYMRCALLVMKGDKSETWLPPCDQLWQEAKNYVTWQKSWVHCISSIWTMKIS